MNRPMRKLAEEVALRLLNVSLLPDDDSEDYEEAVEIIGNYFQPMLYHEWCPDCGSRICPECGDHMLPAMPQALSERELWDLCPECLLYVKKGGEQVPAQSSEGADRRLDEIFAQTTDGTVN